MLHSTSITAASVYYLAAVLHPYPKGSNMNTAAPSPEDSNLDPFLAVIALGFSTAANSTADQIIENQSETIRDQAADFVELYDSVAKLRESFVGTRIDDVLYRFGQTRDSAARTLNEESY